MWVQRVLTFIQVRNVCIYSYGWIEWMAGGACGGVGGWGGTMAKIVTFDVVAKGSYTHSSKNIFVYIADG